MNFVKETLAQIAAKALAGESGVFGRPHAAGHGHGRQNQHGGTQPEDVARISGGDGRVDNLRHHQGQQQLAHGLQHNQNGRQYRLFFIALQMGEKQGKQKDQSSFLLFEALRVRFWSIRRSKDRRSDCSSGEKP